MDADVRRAFAYITPHRRALGIVLLISLVSTALTLYLPYLSKELVDKALLGRSVNALLRIILTFAGITLLSFFLNVISGLRYTKLSADILFAMRLDLYRHLQRLSPRFYAFMPLGQIVSRINNDIGEIQRVLGELALAWIGHILFLIGTTIMLIYLDARLFLVSLVMMPAALWALVRYRRRLESAISAMRDRSADIGTFLIETLQGMRLVVGANAQEREAERFRVKNDAFVDSVMAMRRLTYYSGGLPGLLLSGGTAAVFLYGGWRVIEGTLTLGTLVAFIAYQMRLLSPVQGLMDLYASVATARVSLRRVHDLLDAKVEVSSPANPVRLTHVRGEVRFDDVHLSFGRGGAILSGFDLEVDPGEVVAIVGASGVGKSTIADLLIRQLDPDAGTVALDGRDLRTLSLEDLRRQITVVDQEPFLLNASIAENIRYARPDAADAEVYAAARAAGLEELVARLPQGLNTPAGERGRALSAGERQRLSMARALLTDPAVIVLDEATGALDPATEAQVVSGYESVMRGRTTIVITHRRELARLADRVVLVQDGRVAETGTADELMLRGGAFARLFATLQNA